MKKKSIVFLIVLTFVIEIAITVFLFERIKDVKQDVVKINECIKRLRIITIMKKNIVIA